MLDISCSLWLYQRALNLPFPPPSAGPRLFLRENRGAASESLWPHGLQTTRLLCPWGFSRQEHWSGLPCPPLEDLPNPGIEPSSPALQADVYQLSHQGSPRWLEWSSQSSNQTGVPCAAGKFLANWATKEAQRGFPGGASDKEPACQSRRHKRCGFDPWVGKIPWRRAFSSILSWRIPRTEEPGGLQSVGLQRVGHDWSDLAHMGDLVPWVGIKPLH